jgi:probable F420-dependent oxidoreductase
MRIGVVFPQTEIGEDPGAVRAYAQAAQDLGYAHLVAYDHVIGADTATRPDWRGPYDIDTLFHEVFVLFGFLAAAAPRLEMVTGVLIAPQRQTVLIAKQSAEIDVLTGGKMRLGLGIGWNPVEYDALNENFHNRGRRVEEQIHVLRALFTQRSVTFVGRWHRIEAAGIKPLPVQRPIPIWLGGTAEVVLRRVGYMADGWLPQMPPDDRMRAAIDRIRGYAREAGRDPGAIGIEARVSISGRAPEQWSELVRDWRELGATHLAVNTMGAGLDTPQAHIDAIRQFMEVVSGL